jgi:hypothetical protein
VDTMRQFKTGFALALIFGMTFLSAGTAVNAGTHPEDTDSRNQVTFKMGYFVNVHSHFFPLFQSRIAFGASFNHDFLSRYGYEVAVGLKKGRDASTFDDFLSLSGTVLATRTLGKSNSFHWRIGAGPGMGYRDYSAEAGLLSTSRYHQREFSLIVRGETSLDWFVGPLVVKGSAEYERHLTGDGSRGDFGDTGGVTFLGGLGLRF